MVGMVEAICSRATAFAGRWLRVAVLMVAAAWMRYLESIGACSAGRLPAVGQQLLDPAVQLRGQPREHVLEVDPRLVAIELGRLQQAHHDSSALAGQLASNEQPVAPTESPRPNSILDVVVVDRHSAVQKILAKAHQVIQALVD